MEMSFVRFVVVDSNTDQKTNHAIIYIPCLKQGSLD